jgi:hypothetical protein
MDISGFFATIANNFRSKYLDLAQQFDHLKRPIQNLPQPTPETTAVEPQTVAPEPSLPIDTFQPSGDPTPKAVTPGTTTPDVDAPDTTEKPTGETPVEQKPDGTYYYQRRALLEYDLNLRFDLGTITRTVERMAEGDTTSVESFAAAGFGLHADFDVRGMQKVRTNMADTEATGRRHELTVAGQRAAGSYRAVSNDFAAQGFYKQASRIHRVLNESAQGSHRQAVNQFAARFRLDNRFSMAFAERFNVQTERVASEAPDAVERYLGSAGDVATSGTNEMMASFFDAVDGYLDQSEQAIIDNVTAFFDRAATELGFSETEIAEVRDHLTSTIETFFDRVDSALASVESRFVPQAEIPVPEVEVIEEPVVVPDVAELPEIEKVDPESLKTQAVLETV